MKIFHTYSGEKVKIRFLVSREVGGTITSFSLTNYNSHLILSLDFKLLLLWSNTGEMECLIIALNIYLLIYKLCINLKNIYSFLLHTKVGKCTWLLMACIFFLEFFVVPFSESGCLICVLQAYHEVKGKNIPVAMTLGYTQQEKRLLFCHHRG